MILRQPHKDLITAIICYLYILLFVYAAVSKILDFENFRVQLGQSPLLSAFAGWIAWMVPAVEILIAILLAIPRLRGVGLYLAFGLMTMFTAYIYIVLNFSSFVPCSCGGILEKLGWTEHIIFNLVFILFAITAIFLVSCSSKNGDEGSVKTRTMGYLLALSVGSIGVVFLLFTASENIIHERNNFVRRFPPVAVRKSAETELLYNSYYFAGEENGRIYLGNTTAPSRLLVFDTTLTKRQLHHIDLTSNLVFNAVKIKVIPPEFYVVDGTAPAVFKGNISDYKATLLFRKTPKFTAAEILEADTVALRVLTKQNEFGIGLFTATDSSPAMKPQLLQRQIDGLFDSDGMMLYNKSLKQFIYMYYYRNQFNVANSKLNLLYRGNTIDTTTVARVKITHVKDRNETKLSAPPFLVNRTGSTNGKLLFINSSLPGRFETMEMWKEARIIDVYDLTNKRYVQSFYLYDDGASKMSSFLVTDTHVFVLIGTKLVAYRIGKNLKDRMRL